MLTHTRVFLNMHRTVSCPSRGTRTTCTHGSCIRLSTYTKRHRTPWVPQPPVRAALGPTSPPRRPPPQGDLEGESRLSWFDNERKKVGWASRHRKKAGLPSPQPPTSLQASCGRIPALESPPHQALLPKPPQTLVHALLYPLPGPRGHIWRLSKVARGSSGGGGCAGEVHFQEHASGRGDPRWDGEQAPPVQVSPAGHCVGPGCRRPGR